MSKAVHFTPEFFQFLRELRENNNKEWFSRHKSRYEKTIKAQCLRFIADFAPHLEEISAYFVADTRTVGGSMFRIYRDVRFSKDKTPYKTNAGIQFRHMKGKDVHAPGFYLHLAPDEVFVGSGIWHPDGKTLVQVRAYLDEHQDTWREVREALEHNHTLLGGESLKRPPRGYSADHPLIDDLRRKDFVASLASSEEEACSPGFIERVAEVFTSQAPLVGFLAHALMLDF